MVAWVHVPCGTVTYSEGAVPRKCDYCELIEGTSAGRWRHMGLEQRPRVTGQLRSRRRFPKR